jgi:hypothetical protein
MGPGQLKGGEAMKSAPERRVLSHAVTETQGSGRFGEMEIESICVDVESVGHPAKKPRRRRAEDSEPVELDVTRTGMDAMRVGDRIFPRNDPEGIGGAARWSRWELRFVVDR